MGSAPVTPTILYRNRYLMLSVDDALVLRLNAVLNNFEVNWLETFRCRLDLPLGDGSSVNKMPQSSKPDGRHCPRSNVWSEGESESEGIVRARVRKRVRLVETVLTPTYPVTPCISHIHPHADLMSC